jgi:hypothetical protein
MRNIILHKGHNLAVEEMSQYYNYSHMLENLLKVENGVINLDFINDFARYIYYDIEGNFGIQDNKWINPDINKYNIENLYIQEPHHNTLIYFLKPTDFDHPLPWDYYNNPNIAYLKT